MSNEFLVDVNVVKIGAKIVNFKNRRLEFGHNFIRLTGPAQDELFFRSDQFKSKLLTSPPGRTAITVPFESSEESGLRSVQFQFKRETEQYIDWVINQLNKLIQANIEKIKQEKKLAQPSRSNSRQSNDEKPPPVSIQLSSGQLQKMKASQLPKVPKVTESATLQSDSNQRSDELKTTSNRSHNGNSSTALLHQRVISPEAAPPKQPAVPLPSDREIKTEYNVQSTSSNTLSHCNLYSNSPPILETNHSFAPFVDELRNRRLKNTGNSCYFNSTMQALAVCSSFTSRSNQLRRLIKSVDNNSFENQEDNIKYKVLRDLLDMMFTLTARLPFFEENLFPCEIECSDLTRIRRRIGKINEDFNNDDQQDAHEYFVTLLGSIDDVVEANRKFFRNGSRKEKSVAALNPVDAFKINVEIMYFCRNCQMSDIKKDCRNELMLPIKKRCSVQYLLKVFPEWSKIEKACAHCGFHTAYSSERISKFPQCLVVNLKLYEINNVDFSTKKKDYELEDSFEIDASVLQAFAEKDDIKLEESTIEEQMEPALKTVEMTEYEEEDNKENIMTESVKLLGGNEGTMNTSHSQDIIVDTIKTPSFRFKLLSSYEDIDDILNRVKVYNEDRNENLVNHLKYLSSLEEQEMFQCDLPAQTVNINPDGNCFYRAISWCLTGNQNIHTKLRRATVKYLTENEEMLTKFYSGTDFKKFVENVGKNGEWASTCEIFAMANLLNVRIFTYLGESGWTTHSPWNGESCRDGCIYLNNKNCHFEPTITLRKTNELIDIYAKRRKTSDGDPKAASGEDVCNSAMNATGTKFVGNGIEIVRDCETPGKFEKQEVKEEILKDDLTEYQCNQPVENINYHLVAAICHIGESPNRGHYVAYTKGPLEDDEWMYCSDSCVYEVNKEKVREEISKTGYILFYDRD